MSERHAESRNMRRPEQSLDTVQRESVKADFDGRRCLAASQTEAAEYVGNSHELSHGDPNTLKCTIVGCEARRVDVQWSSLYPCIDYCVMCDERSKLAASDG
jgi:hypothetical protein